MHILSRQCKCLVWLSQIALLLFCELFAGGRLVNIFLVLLREVGEKIALHIVLL